MLSEIKFLEVMALLNESATDENVERLEKKLLEFFTVPRTGDTLVLFGQTPPDTKGEYVAEDVKVKPSSKIDMLSLAKLEIVWKSA
mgnify:CR=1 FL=1